MSRPNTTSTIKEFTIPKRTISEYWNPSVLLRWVEKAVAIDENTGTMKLVLQQLHTSNLGNREWKDVQIETES